MEYFTTPYFVFVRDTLSYLCLLALHFAICLSPSSIPFSSLEWIILVFFMGRILMAGKQFLSIKIKQNKGNNAKKKMALKYQKCDSNEDDGEKQSQRASKWTVLVKKCGKYLR